MNNWHVRFYAALPHELDGVEPTKDDLPLYVERVDELMGENKLLLGHLRVAQQEVTRLTSRGPIAMRCRACSALTVLPAEGGPFTPCCEALQSIHGRPIDDLFEVAR